MPEKTRNLSDKISAGVILNIAEVFRTNLDIYLYDAASLELIDSSIAFSRLKLLIPEYGK